MENETKLVNIVDSRGRSRSAVFEFWECSPINDDLVRLKLKIENAEEFCFDSDNCFIALTNIRELVEKNGLIICCNGSRENVYPSGMILEMGPGKLAYQMKMGKPARRSDLIEILDKDTVGNSTTLKKQRDFYEAWLNSLG